MRERLYHFKKIFLENPQIAKGKESSKFITLITSVNCDLHDVNGIPGALEPDDYDVSKQIGKDLYDADSNGVIWASVRHSGGVCIGLFKREMVMSITYGTQFTFEWDGKGNALARDLQTEEIILQI